MKRLAQKLGTALMLAASLAVAGHIYEHCLTSTANTLINCPVCQSIMASSTNAATPAQAELIFLRDAVLSATPGYYFCPAGALRSRAPPSVLFS